MKKESLLSDNEKVITMSQFIGRLLELPQTAIIDDFELNYTTKFGYPCSYKSNNKINNNFKN